VKEIDPAKASYGDLIAFVMNMLEVANREPGKEDPGIRTAYYGGIVFVAVAKRLETAADRMQQGIADAEQHLRDTLTQASGMFLDAADLAQKSGEAQATIAERYAKHLAFATWVLSGATLILGVATVVLVYYTRLMAMKP
jgi:hypothetical protein